MPQPNWVVTTGFAKEPSWGTVTNPPVFFLSCPKPVFVSKQTSVFDKGLRGIRAETQAFSFAEGHEEIDLPDMPWYGDDSGNLVFAMLGVDAVSNATTKNGTIGSVAAGAVSLTYTVIGGGAPVVGDAFKIDTLTSVGEIVVPTAVSGAGPYTLTVPAVKYAHGAAAPAQGLANHVLTLLNTGNPASYTGAKYDALVATARQSAGVYFEDLIFKFANPGILTLAAKARGKLATNATKGTAVFSSEPFSVPWQATFQLAGIANARVVNFELNLKAPNDQIFGMAATQSPTASIVDQLTALGKITVVPDDYTEFNYYLNNTQPSVLMILDNGATRLDIQMSKVAFMDPTQLEHGGNYTILSTTYEAIANATDAGTGNSPVKITCRNSKATAY